MERWSFFRNFIHEERLTFTGRRNMMPPFKLFCLSVQNKPAFRLGRHLLSYCHWLPGGFPHEFSR
jgi:hypothetical protein